MTFRKESAGSPEAHIFRSSNENSNKALLEGYICKKPIYRKTPLGREITDVMLAVNRQYGKSDYIPCICWGRNARFSESLELGAHVKVSGRIQSRDYSKKIGEIVIPIV